LAGESRNATEPARMNERNAVPERRSVLEYPARHAATRYKPVMILFANPC
jgi:hypothetical protein